MLNRNIVIVLIVALLTMGMTAPSTIPSTEIVPTTAAVSETVPATSLQVPVETPQTAVALLKGVWVTTVFNLDYPSKATKSSAQLKAEADVILDNVKAMGLNAVFLQIRPSGDAFYASQRFPWSQYLTGQQGLAPDGNFDPLTYWVDEAHKRGIELHAWMNPYRVTATQAKAGQDPYKALSSQNPAKLNPQWTVLHTDGKVYYNPGLPEVRNLIVAEVVDIVTRYGVDGIHFDDYFYPDAKFQDQASFIQYGQGVKLEDWRRDNTTTLVKDVYTAIKAVKPSVQFGISPFGIWANAKNMLGGSDTAGNQSYFSHYADTKKWVEMGIIDYIMPQLYWNIGFAVADYQKLVDWWHSVVAPTSVKLYIGMGAYRVGNSDAKSPWFGDGEIERQLVLNRQYTAIKGEVFYRYAFFKSRPSLANAVSRHYEQVANGLDTSLNQGTPKISIKVSSPTRDIVTTFSNYYLAGISDPSYPLYLNGKLVTNRSAKGYFGIFVPIARGVNQFVFTQRTNRTTRVLARGVSLPKGNVASGGTTTTTTTAKPAIVLPKPVAIELVKSSLYPQKNEMWQVGEKVTLTATAPVGAAVTATIGRVTVPLVPKRSGAATVPPTLTSYTAVYTLPQLDAGQRHRDFGKIVYQMTYNKSRHEEKSPAHLTVLTKLNEFWVVASEDTTDVYPFQQTAKGGAHFLSKGMGDRLSAISGTMARVASGFWVRLSDVKIEKRANSPFQVTQATYEVGAMYDVISFEVSGTPAVSTARSSTKLTVDLGEVALSQSPFTLPSGSLATGYTVVSDGNRSKLELLVPSTAKLAGHWATKENNLIRIYLKRPFILAEGNKPLEGLRILIDPGHGGKDPGAISFRGSEYAEKHINLDTSLLLQKNLKDLGAQVYMTRDKDVDMSLQQRLRLSYQFKPDLFLSVHANSIGPEMNIGNIFGFSAHYSDPVAVKLANGLVNEVTKSLGRKSRGAKRDNFYVVRGTWAPSVLIESGFMPNPQEYDWLTDPKLQKQLAESLARGIIESLK